MTSAKRGLGGFADTRFDASGMVAIRSYGEALIALARDNPNIVCLGADLSQPTETTLFHELFPDRFFMMGIQEANMVGAAGGMARLGDTPFAHSFCVFITRRVYDQIAMQAAYPNLPVKLVGFMPGLTTELGISHQAIDDIALMRALPNMVVIEPRGPEQIGAAVKAALDCPGPVYLRLAVAQQAPDTTIPLEPLTLGKGQIVREGKDVAIIACGLMVGEAEKAAEILAKRGISTTVINMASIKPLDRDLVLETARTHRAMISAENHSVIGGLGSAIAETLALNAVGCPFAMVGLDDVFAEGARLAYLLEKYAMAANDIVARAEALLARSDEPNHL